MFIVTLNGIGILLAILNVWQYPRRYTGAFILGNLLFAILMRNEVFGRCLYAFVNTCFAKVGESPRQSMRPPADALVVATIMVQAFLHRRTAKFGWHSLRLRSVGICMAHLPRRIHLHRPQGQPRRCAHRRCRYQHCCLHQHRERVSLGP